MNTVKRKGARSIKEIPAEVLRQLNHGETETANLIEWLAVDQKQLLSGLLLQHNRNSYLAPVLSVVDQLKKPTVNTINEAIGTTLLALTRENNDHDFLNITSSHQADMVRCWSAYTVGHDERLSLTEMFEAIRRFAADTHFGVREICWMAVRHRIREQLQLSISILSG